MNSNLFLNETEAAAYLGLAKATLARWRWRGDRGPSYRKFGGAVRYAKGDLERYASDSEVMS